MKKLLLTVSLALLAWSAVDAVPALRKPQTFTQSDGSTITVTMRGDEFSHSYVSDDGMALTLSDKGDFYYRTAEGTTQVMAHDASQRTAGEQAFVAAQKVAMDAETVLEAKQSARRASAVKSVMKKSQVPHDGSPRVPIVLVQYSDVKFKDSDPHAVFDTQMNGATGETVKQYFNSQSYGKFTPAFDVLGPVTLSNNRAYYGANDSYGDDVRPGEMIKEACDKLDATTDFSVYDNDGDGYVDVVYVIYAGVGEASSNTASSIWPHQWNLVDAIGGAVTYDGVKVDKYGCSNELYNNAVQGIGTFCHEFSHCLGLPDFYNTTYSGNYGMSAWSLMDYGSYNNNGFTPCGYTAYEREFMGWMTIETLTGKNTSLSMGVLADGGKAYRVQSPYSTNEYYLLENRQQAGWDAYIESHGMMVTHVDYSASVWENNEVNNTSSHQRMTIIPADNKLSESNNNGDLFPNGGSATELTDSSTPAAKLYTGGFMGQPITSIAENNGVVTFAFNNVMETPVIAEATQVGANSFTANWESVADADSYTLRVKKVTENAGEMLLTEDFAKFAVGSSDVGSKLDTYMNNAGWFGKVLYSENKALRIGSSKNVGYMSSPLIDLTGADGVATVAITAKSYNSDTGVELSVGLTSDNSETLINASTMTLTATDAMQYVVLEGGDADSYIQIENLANKKRAVVSGITIYAGDASGALAAQGYQAVSAKTAKIGKKTVAARAESTDEQLFTGLTGTSYEVTGLEDGGKYTYQVKAVYADGESSYSATKTVTLATSGIESTAVADGQLTVDGNRLTVNSADPSSVYTIAGTLVPPVGTNVYELAKGVYIVKTGTQVSKIMVK